MTFTTQYLTNGAYGYPTRGAERRIGSTRLMCIHITANPSTPPATAKQERDYANRAGSEGPSAHDYIDRNGDGIHAINPGQYAAWSNGALRSPKTSVPGVAEVVALDARPVPEAPGTTYNPNEAYWREVECCGRYPDYPILPAQVETLARLIAADSADSGIPISRATVHLHSDLDSVGKPNCPVPAAQAEAFVTSVIEKAITIKTTQDLGTALLRITALETENAVLDATISTMNGEIDDLTVKLEALQDRVNAATSLLENGTEFRAHAILTGDSA